MSWLNKRIMHIVGSSGANASYPVSGSPLYRLGIISDAHLISNNGTYAHCDKHLAAALNNLHNMGAQEIISCGDSAVNGTDAEWQLYLSVLDASPFGRAKVHECNGNHDGAAPALTTFKQYSNNGALSGGNPYFAIDLFGDRFIFMSLDQGTSPSGGECFTDAQMTWLQSELAAHYGKSKNVWLIEHALFQGWGTGDNITKPGYTNGLKLSYENHALLKDILIAHPDIIMLHGHSHIQLEDRDTYGLEVYATPEKGGCHQFHVPSITAQKYFKSAGSLQVDSSLGQSECWFCEVWTNKIVFRGIHAYTGEEIPNMVYTIEK